MKKYIIKYTFEFLVIVMGISVSFLVQNSLKEKELGIKRELIFRNDLYNIMS